MIRHAVVKLIKGSVRIEHTECEIAQPSVLGIICTREPQMGIGKSKQKWVSSKKIEVWTSSYL